MAVNAQTTHAGHEYVDLGLPSGTLWATCNVGAINPEDYGDYFAWGETEPKEDYSWATLKYWDNDADAPTKYTNSDGPLTLEAADDAAAANWGGKWRMPTEAEQEELYTKCTWTWTELNGINGYRITGSNENSIFLPAAGYRGSTSLYKTGTNGYFWSSSLTKSIVDSENADHLTFTSTYQQVTIFSRFLGQSVRPVYSEKSNIVSDYKGHEYVDLGLSSGVLWATCNIGSSEPMYNGDYFAWGETTTKGTYDWATYKYCNGSLEKLTKYCTNTSYGNNGFIDNKTILDSEDDAATVIWGGAWRMPTLDEIKELYTECTWTWTKLSDTSGYSINGYIVTGNNGNSIFLPAAGFIDHSGLRYSGEGGYYWSSSLDELDKETPYYAGELDFGSIGYYYGIINRCYGYSVRPVVSKESITVVEIVEQTNSDNTRKVIENGYVVIIRDGVRYNVLGTALK